jgi:hypothetical protein
MSGFTAPQTRFSDVVEVVMVEGTRAITLTTTARRAMIEAVEVAAVDAAVVAEEVVDTRVIGRITTRMTTARGHEREIVACKIDGFRYFKRSAIGAIYEKNC